MNSVKLFLYLLLISLHVNAVETIAQAIETDPIGYLVKPYDEDDLKAFF